MLNSFRDLPTGQKIGAVCLAFVAIVCIAMFAMSFFNNDEPTQPQPTETTSSPDTEPEPTVEPEPTATEEPSPSATPSEAATATASEMPEITYGESDLSVDEIRALQSVANKGLVEFFTWNPDENSSDPESIEERQARIAPYVTKDSPLLNLSPTFEDITEYEDSGEVAAVISRGTIDYINPIGGTEETYRLTVGAMVRVQYNYNDSSTEPSSIVESNSTVAVDMTKTDGAWKIKTVSEE